jgi:phage gpG-like protein
MATTVELTAPGEVLASLTSKLGNLQPFLTGFGEDMMERTKRRFTTATAPDGSRWAPNTRVTIMRYLNSRGAFSGKTGKISAKGQSLAISKLPLQGATRDLARQFFSEASDDTLTMGNSMVYAAMQHYGGKRSTFPSLWGDIPARPYMPLTAAGDLAPTEADLLTSQLSDYLLG